MTEQDNQHEDQDNAPNTPSAARLSAMKRQRELLGGDDELCGRGDEFHISDALQTMLRASDMTEDIANGRLLLTVLNKDLIEESIERYRREREQNYAPGQRTVQIVLLERVLGGLSTTREDVLFSARTENQNRNIAAVNEHRCYDNAVSLFISRKWIGIQKPDAAGKKE